MDILKKDFSLSNRFLRIPKKRGRFWSGLFLFALVGSVFWTLFPGISFLGTSFSFVSAETYRLMPEEKKAIENRKKIDKFQIEIKYEQTEAVPRSGAPKIVGMTFYQDGDNIRQDTRYKRKVSIPGEEDFYTEIRLWTPDQFIYFLQGRNEAGDQCAVDIRPRADAIKEGWKLPRDVRVIGMNGSGFLFDEPLEKNVGCLERINSKCVDEKLGDIACKKFEYVHARYGTVYTYWIAPELGNSVLRIQAYADGKPRTPEQEAAAPMTNRTDVTVEEFKHSGLWFPRTMNFTRKNDKGETLISQKLDINVVSLNERVSPEVFSLDGLNIPVGHLVMQRDKSIVDNFFWDGDKIQSEREALLEKPAPSKRYVFLWTIIIVLGLGLISAAFITRYFQLKNKKQH